MILRRHVQAALPDYDIGAELGRGAFGRVFAGRHRRLDREVAVKTLEVSADDTADADAEAQIIARLDHPHIVRVYDYVRDADMALLVMELLPGGTLTQRAGAGAGAGAGPRDGLGRPAAAAVVAALGVALDRVHGAGLLHRDIKPSNVLFALDGAPKLTDFGIASLLEATGAVEPTSVIGSTPYMAPERFDLAVPGVGVDIYALGAVLYELLAGHPPFGSDPRPHVMADRHRTAEPPPLPHVPAPLEAVARRALRKDPADRQPSSLVFARDLVVAADRVFGPGWLAGTGIAFRGDDDLRRPSARLVPATLPYQPHDVAGVRPPADQVADPYGAGVGPGPPGGVGPPDAVARPDGTARPDGPAGFRRRSPVRPLAVMVVMAVLALCVGAVVLVRAGSSLFGSGSATAGPTPTAAPTPTGPVDAAIPLRGWLSLATLANGDVFLADSSQHSLTMFSPRTRKSVTVIGSAPERVGQPGTARDEPAVDAALSRPGGIAVFRDSVFVADTLNCVVRRVYRDAGGPWRVETVAGRAAARVAPSGATVDPERQCPAGRPGLEKPVGAPIGTPTDVAVDQAGNLYVTSGYAGQVWRINRAYGDSPYTASPARLLAGNGAQLRDDDADARETRYRGNATPATKATLENPYSVTVGKDGRVYILSVAAGQVRIHYVAQGLIHTIFEKPMNEVGVSDLYPAADGPGVLLADFRQHTVWELGDTFNALRPVLTKACRSIDERLFGLATDPAGNLYYSCNNAGQAFLYQVPASTVAAGGTGGTGPGGTGPGRRLLD